MPFTTLRPIIPPSCCCLSCSPHAPCASGLACSYFDQPLEEKLKLPRVDWGRRKLLGYEINRLPGGATEALTASLADLALVLFKS